ncbi:MAG: MBL fold metallo-hydrolase [Chloroflexota bacterium]|nr:MBL fold metallo-hydrolase [Chloroflexota bacterium]
MTHELRPGIFQFRAKKPGSHVYLIKGTHKNVLIDTGLMGSFPRLEKSLLEVGVRACDIDLIVLTHEHFDHIGATSFFYEDVVVAAHRLAANKIELQDEFVTMMKSMNAGSTAFHADVWLEHDTLIDLGNYRLRALHTPGHTSGCICLYEPGEGLLFTGDTVFAGGTLSGIFGSGNISDYMNSLERLSTLRVTQLYPGHGWVSDSPEEDIRRGLEHARALFEDTKILFETLTRGGN